MARRLRSRGVRPVRPQAVRSAGRNVCHDVKNRCGGLGTGRPPHARIARPSTISCAMLLRPRAAVAGEPSHGCRLVLLEHGLERVAALATLLGLFAAVRPVEQGTSLARRSRSGGSGSRRRQPARHDTCPPGRSGVRGTYTLLCTRNGSVLARHQVPLRSRGAAWTPSGSATRSTNAPAYVGPAPANTGSRQLRTLNYPLKFEHPNSQPPRGSTRTRRRKSPLSNSGETVPHSG